MKGFAGFPGGPVRMTPVPEPLFTELLPQIDHLGELKVTLHVLWRLARQDGPIRYLSLGELRSDADLLAGLGGSGEEALSDALERAVARGTLLAVRETEPDEAYYFLNSPRGRAAAEGLAAGTWHAADHPHTARTIDRPNVFSLYEQNIGMVTPMLADKLRQAERDYPENWIFDAFSLSIERNKRSWAYISYLLQDWAKNGKDQPPQTGRSLATGSFGSSHESDDEDIFILE